MVLPAVRLLALAFAVALAAACGPPVDLTTDIEVVEVETGWYDNGVKDGRNHMLPSIAFRLRNVSDHEVSSVWLTVAFWRTVDDGEMSSAQLRGIGSEGLAPGERTDVLLVRPDVGYTLEGPRSEFFVHSDFVDASARVFGRHSGGLVQLGEFPIERRIIPTSSSPGGR